MIGFRRRGGPAGGNRVVLAGLVPAGFFVAILLIVPLDESPDSVLHRHVRDFLKVCESANGRGYCACVTRRLDEGVSETEFTADAMRFLAGKETGAAFEDAKRCKKKPGKGSKGRDDGGRGRRDSDRRSPG